MDEKNSFGNYVKVFVQWRNVYTFLYSKKIYFSLCILLLFAILSSGCETEKEFAKKAWQSIFTVDSWVRRNTW